MDALTHLERLREIRGRDRGALPESQQVPLEASRPVVLDTGAEPDEGRQANPKEPPWDAGAADVLQLLVSYDQPVSHSQIVKTLVQRGRDPGAVREAISRVQASGWIQHNLTSGYVVSSDAPQGVPEGAIT